ncbi:hypothetical protein DYB26_012544 [Aphanomyces astaci]|uniref:Uncharacterized protein n=1 Tax=Aphanomyces astaci TaxID=112090 RepID=A0A418EC81_APHAT|nr:hypothetical protein DYB26_012544 [Aphanomyces astaci]
MHRCDLYTMADGMNVGRGLWLQSQSFTKHHGVVPLDEDAAEYDIDLTSCPHHLTEARFPTLFIEAVLQNAQTGLSVRMIQ